MPSKRHVQKLLEGPEAWNRWRKQNPDVKPDLSGAFLPSQDVLFHGSEIKAVDAKGLKGRRGEVSLRGVDLQGADLSGAVLLGADAVGADLRAANLAFANLSDVDFRAAELEGAQLRFANFSGANLHLANFRGADLTGADLSRALMIRTTLDGATLDGCRIYGVAVWNLSVDDATKQRGLVITTADEPAITIDDIEVAQFIYLIRRNDRIRKVIDALTSKVVLILGRFTPERKSVLDAIRDDLKRRDYVPVIFDFDKPTTRDTHETLTTLARLARFVIADITDPKSIPQELVSIVEQMPSLPIQPILKSGSEPWGMYDHIKKYPWVLSVSEYQSLEELLPRLGQSVIDPPEAKLRAIRGGK